MNEAVDWFFNKETKWQKEYNQLRKIVLNCGLIEELKWGVPCYTFQKTNVVLLHGFKEYCALLFHKGVLIEDTDGLLIQQTENVQSARQIRFTDLQQINELEAILKTYIFQAIEVEKAGLTVELKKTEEYPVADEFKIALDKNDELATAFDALTPGRKRAYLMYFSQAKQAKTRIARVEKCIPKIMEGKGLDD